MSDARVRIWNHIKVIRGTSHVDRIEDEVDRVSKLNAQRQLSSPAASARCPSEPCKVDSVRSDWQCVSRDSKEVHTPKVAVPMNSMPSMHQSEAEAFSHLMTRGEYLIQVPPKLLWVANMFPASCNMSIQVSGASSNVVLVKLCFVLGIKVR